jgi:hypothetical protein
VSLEKSYKRQFRRVISEEGWNGLIDRTEKKLKAEDELLQELPWGELRCSQKNVRPAAAPPGRAVWTTPLLAVRPSFAVLRCL